MSLVHADITLTNGENLVLAKRHVKAGEKVKQLSVNMLVENGVQMKMK